jgi:hypothetical protein
LYSQSFVWVFARILRDLNVTPETRLMMAVMVIRLSKEMANLRKSRRKRRRNGV